MFCVGERPLTDSVKLKMADGWNQTAESGKISRNYCLIKGFLKALKALKDKDFVDVARKSVPDQDRAKEGALLHSLFPMAESR